jgi:hypothetical protein
MGFWLVVFGPLHHPSGRMYQMSWHEEMALMELFGLFGGEAASLGTPRSTLMLMLMLMLIVQAHAHCSCSCSLEPCSQSTHKDSAHVQLCADLCPKSGVHAPASNVYEMLST